VKRQVESSRRAAGRQAAGETTRIPKRVVVTRGLTAGGSPEWRRRLANVVSMNRLVALSCLLAVGCHQEMAVQPNYHRALEPSSFFADGRSSRPIVEGTVARGHLRDDPHLFTGKQGDEYATTFPIEVTEQVLARGRQRYEIFCAVCHDRVGTGNGIIVQRGFSAPPSFHKGSSRGYRPRGQLLPLSDAPPGYFYEVISNGLGSMASYSSEVPVNDRWAIVAHIRVLQLSQTAPRDALPREEREQHFPLGGEP